MIWLDVDANLAEVPVNIMPMVDDTDGKTIETCTYNQAGLSLYWNFLSPAGAFSHTAVTPTTAGGNYGWVSQGNGICTIEMPATGGASINNNTEGFGWFTGVATGILPWCGPVLGFRAAGLNDKMIESAYDAARGLGGTALPAAAADAAGGLPISDAGGLDVDAVKNNVATLIAGLTPVSGTVNDAAASGTTFITSLSSATNDFYRGQAIVFTSGALAGTGEMITQYIGASKTIVTLNALPSAPANGVAFTIVNVAAFRKMDLVLAAANGATGKVAATVAAGDGTDAAAVKVVTDKVATMIEAVP